MLVNEQLGPVSEKQRKVLVEVQQQCARLSGLLKELAELAELVNPETQALTRDEIPVAALIDEATGGLEGGAGAVAADGQGGRSDRAGRPQAVCRPRSVR